MRGKTAHGEATPMQTPTPLEQLLDLAADLLGHDRRTLPARASGSPFMTLGGGLGQAMRLQALAGERLELSLDIPQLLGPVPLADVLARAVAVPRGGVPEADCSGPRALLPGQLAALTAQQYTGAAAVHRMLSAELTGPLDLGALRTALDALSARHEGLRTAFGSSPRGPVRRVLDAYALPLVVMAKVTVGAGEDPVAAAHARLVVDVEGLTGHPQRPPLAFALTRLAADRHLLTFLYHEAALDCWSVALVWRELLADYGRAVRSRPLDGGGRRGGDPVARRAEGLDRSGALRAPAAERVKRLREFPAVVDLAGPGRRPAVFDFRGDRLLFGLGPGLREAVDATAARAGVPHSVVVLSAWALTAGRRSGHERLLVGTELPRRPTAELMGTVAPCSATVPVCCELEGGVDYFLRGVACEFGEALGYADLDTAALARELGAAADRSRPALTQVAFAACDELLPETLEAGPLTSRFHHGHLGGATADATLRVLRWGGDPLLGLEFACGVFTRAEAVELAGELRGMLEALTDADAQDPVEDLPAGAGGGAAAGRARSAAAPLG
ncbi:condensation domain-containing protein [Streptomyces sp. NPDC058401]|uniref:condensation domain-containing protein n=1 Tax=Streptomyces sp. NPDC058401 TaxID=3346480 RepID=UPI0036460CA5